MSKTLIATLALASLSGLAAAAFSANTVQMPASVVIEAKVLTGADGKRHVEVTWTDPMKVTVIEHYVGPDQKGGFVKPIQIGDAKKVVLEDVAKNGARFNAMLVGGKFLHLECGGNKETTMPTLKGGLKVDCSEIDKATGQKVGALVVDLK